MADCWVCGRNVEEALCATVSLDGCPVAVCDDCMTDAQETSVLLTAQDIPLMAAQERVA